MFKDPFTIWTAALPGCACWWDFSSGKVSAADAGTQTLLTIEPSKENPRNSEGDIIELKDGRLCLIYTRFTGGGGDDAAADLAMRISPDRGRTWSDDKIVVRHTGGLNVMSVSLLRLASGEIALFYLRKTSQEDCRPLMCLSTDEAADLERAHRLHHGRGGLLRSEQRPCRPVAQRPTGPARGVAPGSGPQAGHRRRDHVLPLRRQRQDLATQQRLVPGLRSRAGSASPCRSRAWSS